MAARGVGWVLAVAWLFAGCGVDGGDDAPRPDPSILLITLDTTRADRIGAYGYAQAQTPTLDALAREGILFESAFSPTPITLPSHASILTGLYPPEHGVRDNALFVLDPEALLVSEVLKRNGWRTGAFVASAVLRAKSGIDQGFEIFREPLGTAGKTPIPERPADKVIDDAVAWLGDVDPQEKFFAWIHFYDPHAPYSPPEPWRSRHPDAYDGEIAFCDGQIERLLRFLKKRGLDQNLLIAITADHGEGLGEHDEATHGTFLYQGSVRVPLILSGSALSATAGTRVAEVASNVGLAATLVELAGLQPSEMPETKLLPLWSRGGGARAKGDRAIYFESLMPFFSWRWHAFRGVVHENWKLIEGRNSELYDLRNDPHESNNQVAARPELATEMRGRLEALLASHPARLGEASRSPDAEEKRLLESLGYTVGSRGGDPFDPNLPDVGSKIAVVERRSEALALFERWRESSSQKPAATAWEKEARQQREREFLESARQRFLEIERENPNAQSTPVDLGTVEVALGNFDAAIALLEKALEEHPASSEIRFNLALAYEGVGRGPDAVRAMREAVSLANPVFTQYYEWLALHYANAGQFGRAAWWLGELLELLRAEDARRGEIKRRLRGVEKQMREADQALNPAPELPVDAATR